MTGPWRVWVWGMVACCGWGGAADPPAPTLEGAAGPGLSTAESVLHARQVGTAAKLAVQGRIGRAMASGGVSEALEACRVEADGILARIAGDEGVRIGRMLRPADGSEDRQPAWVAAWMVEHQDRSARQITPWSTVDEARGVVRGVEPLELAPVCARCHGTARQVPRAVRAELPTQGQGARFRGWTRQDWIGVVWIEKPLTLGPLEGGG